MNILTTITIAVFLLITLPFLGALMPFILGLCGTLFNQLYTENPVAAVMAALIPFIIVIVLLVRAAGIGSENQVAY